MPLLLHLEDHITIGEPYSRLLLTGLLQQVLHHIRGEPQKTNLNGLKSK